MRWCLVKIKIAESCCTKFMITLKAGCINYTLQFNLRVTHGRIGWEKVPGSNSAMYICIRGCYNSLKCVKNNMWWKPPETQPPISFCLGSSIGLLRVISYGIGVPFVLWWLLFADCPNKPKARPSRFFPSPQGHPIQHVIQATWPCPI